MHGYLVKYPRSLNMLYFVESEEIADDQGKVNRLSKKTKDEISVENREKEASGESSVKAVFKESGIQSPEGKIGRCMTVSRDLVNIENGRGTK